MNVKIDHTGLRFRITANELAILQSGETLAETLAIGRRRLSIAVDPVGASDELIAVYDQDIIRLLVSPGKIAALAAMGRSREGLEQEREGVILSLQVDFRTQKRQPA